MNDITNNERLIYINQALQENKLNKQVFELVEDFTDKYSFKKSQFIDGVVDPGTKSGKSLFLKLERKAKDEKNTYLNLMDVTDLIRCSIIVENYEKVVPLIKELQKRIPNLNGDISENSTGYKGVHLTFFVNGLRAELQIATCDVWFAKQAGEGIYSRWRDYDQSKKINEINNEKDQKQKSNLVEQFFNDLQQMEQEKNDCKKLFDSVYKLTDFEQWKDEINACLIINNTNKNNLENKVIKKYLIKKDDNKKKDDILKLCEEISLLAKKSQEKLILIATKALIISKNIKYANPQDSLSEEEKAFLLFKKEYETILIEQCKKKYGEQFQKQDYISIINKISNQRSLEAIEFCKKRNFIKRTSSILKKLKLLVNYSKMENITISGIEELEEKIEKDILRKQQIDAIIKK